MNTLEYKGYKGTIETEDDTLFGYVLGLKNAIISYEEKNIDELRDDFRDCKIVCVRMNDSLNLFL